MGRQHKAARIHPIRLPKFFPILSLQGHISGAESQIDRKFVEFSSVDAADSSGISYLSVSFR